MVRKLLFVIISITNFTAFSQCLSGDCENGYGTYKFPNGGTNEGSWINGKLNGKCIIIMGNGNGDKYVGDVSNGVYQGKGTYYYSNGDKYVGDFVSYNYQGKGTYYYNNGDVFVGDFVNNYPTKGTKTFNNGNKYVGDLVSGAFQGEGTFYYNNGEKYIGNFVNNARQGFGIYVFLDGSKYEGEWVNNRWQGKGKRTYSSGLVEEGIFANGTYVGEEKQVTQNDSNLTSNENLQSSTNNFPNSTLEDLTIDGRTIKSKLEKIFLDLYSKAYAMEVKNSLLNKSTTKTEDYIVNELVEVKNTVDGWLGGPMTKSQLAEFLAINKTTVNEVKSSLGLLSTVFKNSSSSSSSSSYSSSNTSSSSKSTNSSVCSYCKPKDSKGWYITDFNPSNRTYPNGRYVIRPGHKPCDICQGTGDCRRSCSGGKRDCPGVCLDDGTCKKCNGDRFLVCNYCKGSGKN